VDGEWSLIAYCHLRKGVGTFLPARIRELEITNERFELPRDFNIDKFVGPAFGVMIGDGATLHDVRIRFRGFAAINVGERRWHASQLSRARREARSS